MLYVSNVKRCQFVKKCQMSNSQTSGLWRRFAKKEDIMRFTDIDVNFDIRYEGHQICPKMLFKNILRVLVTIICDVKIDINICEPYCVNLFFWEPPP